MKRKSKNAPTSSADEFFEDIVEERVKAEKKAQKETVTSHKEPEVGEFYGKNVVYHFKDGTTCTVMYNKEKKMLERRFNS